ncbi:Peptidase family M48 [Xenococcus sp. PCC 7305]|uniref:M48 family metallopeptidase n=1 Tax=Xenococcus sp. PCC 7305 TaxID=102125 RepID=UPI0002AC5D26|nr:M48 family metallopeptidase [Xenococcus sp. PCC 7305]ELS05494.1 Peptidase family M48 [Xenococcus sp. PCC 7305]
MKLYLNLLSIFLSIFAITNLAIAQCFAHSETTETATTEVVKSDLEGDAIAEPDLEPNETEVIDAEESAVEEAIIFVQCPATELVTDSQTSPEDSDQELVTQSEITEEKQQATDTQAEPEEIIVATTTTTESKIEESEEIATESDDPEAAKNEEIEEKEESTQAIDCLTPEEVVRYHKLSIADNLFKTGNRLTAAQIYQEEKTPWHRELDPSKILPKANNDPTKLSPGAAVYWRVYQEGKAQGLESKILTPLALLVENEPQFIPGHITYAESLLDYEKEEESLAVLDRAISLYPKNTELLRAKIASDVRAEQWLEASITSRQFALFYPELPEAAEFTQLADEYLEEFKSEIREKLTFNAIGNAITGAVGFALTGNIFGPISAIDTTVLLLQGESTLGAKFAKRAQKQLPMVENEDLLNYVREVGQRIAAVSGRDEFEFEFYIVMDENINAFALPGGKVFVNLGIILNTDSEAELAGLLAHEAAHAVLSHGFQLATSGSLTANITQYVPYVGGTAGNLIVMNYSREMERQADIFGTRMLVASDYAADGVRNLMAQLQELNEQDEDYVERPAWVSTHPNTSERVRYMEEFIVENNLNRYNYEGVKRHYRMKQLAKQIWREYEENGKLKIDE